MSDNTMFAAPSPKNTNRAQLYLNKRGELMDRNGAFWGRSQIKKMAMDAALGAPPDTGEREWGPQDWAVNHTRHALGDAIEEACTAHGLDDEQHKALRDLVEQHLFGTAENKGMGAVDKSKGKGAIDEDDEIDRKVREYLKGHGLDDESVERAIAIARKDREAAATDRLPVPATRGGMGGYRSGVSKDDFDVEYPNNLIDMPDYSPDPDRFSSGYDPLKMRDPAARLPGGGTSRRLPAGDAALDDGAIERQLEEDYGSSGPRIGAFG
jgi:hypothetical protein